MTISVTHSTPADSSFSSTGATAWNADHTLTGVGTVAEQNANNVAITGGNIDGTVIGNTTAAAGTFTTLNTTGLTTLKTSSGTTVAVLDDGVTSDRYSFLRDTGGGAFLRFNSGSGGLRNATANGVTFQTNNGTTQAIVSHTASAVNYVQVTGSATLTGAPTLSAQGSDANIPMRLMFKGNGGGSGGGIQLVNSSGWNGLSVQTVNNPNWINIAGVASGSAPVISALGSDTNIPLVLQPKGTGALQAQQTDSTATGGNARGANAVDWQTNRNNANQVASAQFSTLLGGSSNRVSSYGGFVGGGEFNLVSSYDSVAVAGASNQATGGYSFVGGGLNNYSTGSNSVSVGGYFNTASGFNGFVGGGERNSTTSSAAVTTQATTTVTSGSTAVTLSGSNAAIKVGQLINGTGITGYPNLTYVAAISGTSLTLSQAASGSGSPTLSFFTPNGVVVGGGNNQATGSYSFIGGGGDAGTAGNRNVASGDYSVVVGGVRNTASQVGAVVCGGGTFGSGFSGNTSSGASSFVGAGLGNTASGNYAGVPSGANNLSNAEATFVAGGYYGNSRAIAGNTVFAASTGPVASATGVSQTALLVLGAQTTDATATVLRSNTSAASTTNQVILPNNSAYYFKGTVVAGVTGGGNTKGWTVEGVIKRGANAASTAIVGTATVVSAYADAGAATWALTATADTTNGGLAITFTGQAGTTIRVVARLETTEMTY